jgi:hypothetical protein
MKTDRQTRYWQPAKSGETSVLAETAQLNHKVK